jgi:hypothetical protein
MDSLGFSPGNFQGHLEVEKKDPLPDIEPIYADSREERQCRRNCEYSLLFLTAHRGEDSPQMALGDLVNDHPVEKTLGFKPLMETGPTASFSEDSSCRGAAEASQTPTDSRNLKEGKATLSEISLEDLGSHFHLTFDVAAKELGVCQTSLKKVCRNLGVKKWPGRTIRAKQKQWVKNAKV